MRFWCAHSALIVTLGLAPLALAQTGTYTWQVSLDGATWNSALDAAPGSTVRVRLLAGWNGITGARPAFAIGEFDGRIQNGGGDAVTAITRPTPFNYSTQVLAAQQIGTDLKLDVASDTAGFGLGAGWIQPYQVGSAIPEIEYNTNNPAVVFTYSITLANSFENRTIDMILNPAAGSAMAVYLDGFNMTRMSTGSVTVNSATIVVPAPASCGALLLAIGARRRTRDVGDRAC